jgi:hypothetical protein
MLPDRGTININGLTEVAGRAVDGPIPAKSMSCGPCSSDSSQTMPDADAGFDPRSRAGSNPGAPAHCHDGARARGATITPIRETRPQASFDPRSRAGSDPVRPTP